MAILTISRQFGSGGREIGHTIAQVMHYEYIDRQKILEDMSKEGAFWKDKAEYFDENYPDLWERNDWAYRGFVALNQSYFLQHAVRGNVVIMGRGGNFLLKKFPFVLKVRIIAPLEKRIERIMAREGVNKEIAQYLIEKADTEMAKAVYIIYGKNIDDPREYDFVFDTAQKSQDEIVSIIKNALIEKDKYQTLEAMEALKLRALAEKIKAAILTDPQLLISAFDVDPQEEGLTKFGLTIRGIVHNRDDIERIKKVTRTLAGNLPLEFQIHYQVYSRIGPRYFK